MGVLDPPRGQERAAGPSCVLILLGAEGNVVGALEFGTSEWSDPMGRAGVPGHPETLARIADPQQLAEQPLRARAQGREAAAARCAIAAAGVRRASPVCAVVRTQWGVDWCLESEWCMLFGGAIGLLLRPGVERYVKARHARGASIPNALEAMRSGWSRPPVGVGRHNGKQC
eukprot:4531043-Pyramimonas_sp.AAC.1